MMEAANPSLITSTNDYLFGPFARNTAQLDDRTILTELFGSVVVVEGERDWPSEQPVVTVVSARASAGNPPAWYRDCRHVIHRASHPASQFGPVSFSALAMADGVESPGPVDHLLVFMSSTDLHRFIGAVRKRGVDVLPRPPLAGDAAADPDSEEAPIDTFVGGGGPALSKLKQLVGWYLAPSGLMLASVFVFFVYALIGLPFARIAGLIGLGILALFLPYRFERQERRALRLIAQNRSRVARVEKQRR